MFNCGVIHLNEKPQQSNKSCVKHAITVTTQTRRLTSSLLAEQENDLDTVITQAATRFQVILSDSTSLEADGII